MRGRKLFLTPCILVFSLAGGLVVTSCSGKQAAAVLSQPFNGSAAPLLPLCTPRQSQLERTAASIHCSNETAHNRLHLPKTDNQVLWIVHAREQGARAGRL